MDAMGLAHVPPRLGYLATMALCAMSKGVAGHHARMGHVGLVPHCLWRLPRTPFAPIYRCGGYPFFNTENSRKIQINSVDLSPYFSLL